MFRFTRFVCNFFSLLVAAVLCGSLAFFFDPQLLTRGATPSTLTYWGIIILSGFFICQGIDAFGNLFLGRTGPWFFHPAGGVFLLVGLAAFGAFAFHFASMIFRIDMLAGTVSQWAATLHCLASTLLFLTFTIGAFGYTVDNQPTDTNLDDTST